MDAIDKIPRLAQPNEFRDNTSILTLKEDFVILLQKPIYGCGHSCNQEFTEQNVLGVYEFEGGQVDDIH